MMTPAQLAHIDGFLDLEDQRDRALADLAALRHKVGPLLWTIERKPQPMRAYIETVQREAQKVRTVSRGIPR